MALASKFGTSSSQPCLISPKQISLHFWKTKRETHETLNLTAYKSIKSGQLSLPRWIYLAITIPTLTAWGMGIIAVSYKCKKRSSKIYRLSRNRSKTMETPGYNAVPVYIGNRDDVYTEGDNSMQHEEDSVVLTGVKQKWKPGQHCLF